MVIVSEPSTPITPVANQTTQPIATIGGVPMSMIEYFDLDYRNLEPRDKKQLNEIYEYFSGKPIEEIWSAMREIEQKRGLGTIDSRHARVHRVIKINKQIQQLQAQRESI